MTSERNIFPKIHELQKMLSISTYVSLSIELIFARAVKDRMTHTHESTHTHCTCELRIKSTREVTGDLDTPLQEAYEVAEAYFCLSLFHMQAGCQL